MAVDIKSLIYAGVWREPSPVAAVYPPGNVCTDWSGSGRHGASRMYLDGSHPTRLPLHWEQLTGVHSRRFAAVVDRDRIRLSYSSGVDVRAFACWCSKVPESLAGLAEKCDPTTRLGWGIGMANVSGWFRTNGGVGGVGEVHTLWPNSVVVFPENTLNHVAVCWSDAYVKAWVNGVQTYDAELLLPPQGNAAEVDLAIAQYSGNHSGFSWHGSLTDVLLRSTPWTDAEVAWLANPANDLRATGGPRQLLHSPHLLGSFP